MTYLASLLAFFVSVYAVEQSTPVVGNQFFIPTSNGPAEVRIVADYKDNNGKKKFDAEIIRSNSINQQGKVLKEIDSLYFMNSETGACQQGFCVGQTRTWTYDYNSKISRQVNILAIAKYSNTNCDFIGEGPGLFSDNRHIIELVCHKFEDFK